MAKMYTLFGTARDKTGRVCVRGANEEARVAVLTKAGFTDINFLQLPMAMNKIHGCKFAIRYAAGYFNDEEHAAFNKYLTINDDGTEVVLEFENTENESVNDSSELAIA
jgi:hypothetical protein